MKNINTTETTAMVCFSFGSVATVGVTLYEGLSIDECIALRSEDIEEYKIQGGEWTTRKATAEEARKHLEEIRNEVIEDAAAADLDQTAKDLLAVRQMIEELQAEAEALTDKIKAAMIDRGEETLTGDGWKSSWRNVVSNRFDSVAFKKAEPDLYKSFTRQTTTCRFLISAV